MHFAMPPRKTSQPPPYAMRQSKSPLLQQIKRTSPKLLALYGLGAIAILYILSGLFGSSSSTSSSESIPSGTPPVVLVTAVDPTKNDPFVERIKENRRRYAAKQGYAVFFPNQTDYQLGDSPTSWAKVPGLRHAMTRFKHSTYFLYLDQRTLIANPSINLETHITSKSRLEHLMITNVPVVPPDSVIRTFAHLKGDRIDLVLTQDREGLAANSFIVRRGDWAKFFLDAWFDRLYRSYNFQKAEAHALEHIVQWHGTVLAKLALIPQRMLNSYYKDPTGQNAEALYAEGDFIISFPGCEKEGRDCEKEMTPFLDKDEGKKATSSPGTGKDV